jgi:chromosome segregation ATPase
MVSRVERPAAAPVLEGATAMSLPPPTAIESALARLRASLSLLEAVAARRSETDRSKGTLETELALMQDDRARLAVELDTAIAKANRLDSTTQELARRVDRAMGSVRSVLDAAGDHG